jgi:hypothetical protein
VNTPRFLAVFIGGLFRYGALAKDLEEAKTLERGAKAVFGGWRMYAFVLPDDEAKMRGYFSFDECQRAIEAGASWTEDGDA